MYPTPLPLDHLSDSNKPIGDNNDHSYRLYQVWRGNNTFFLSGRLIFGPDVRSIFLTLFLILAPVILFCAYVSPGLIDGMSHHWGIVVLLVCVVWTIYVVLLLFITSGRDPGILPRNLHPPDPDDYDQSSISTDWAGSHSGVSSLPPTKNVIVNRKAVKVKYCRTCMFYRPPRCSHCSVCNNCVERFDHHCPWVGQCIGRRNYRYFFMFVSATTLLCLYVFAFCWVNIAIISKTNHCNMWRATLRSPVSGVLIIYTFFVAWFVGGLTIFHLYLICTNQTTYENFRYHYDRKSNPYNIGCAKNMLEVLFSKIPTSRNNFRDHVIPDPSSMSNNSSNMQQRMTRNNQTSSFDLEIENRQGVHSGDIEDMRTDITSGRTERSENHSRNDSWGHQRGDWEIILDNTDLIPDEHIPSTEFQHNVHDNAS